MAMVVLLQVPPDVAGMHVFKANDVLIDVLKKNNKLLFLEKNRAQLSALLAT